MVNAGIISRELGEQFDREHPWYSPMRYSDFSHSNMQKGRGAGAFSIADSGVMKLSEVGSARDVRASLEVLYEQLIRNEVRLNRNESIKAMIMLGEEAQVPGLKAIKWENWMSLEAKRKPLDVADTLTFMVDGKPQAYAVPEWMAREADMMLGQLNNPVSSLVGALNGISRAAYTTFSPAFIAANMLNDMLVAYVSRGIMPHETAMRLIGSIKGLADDPIMQAFRLSGGYQQRFFGRTGEELYKGLALYEGNVLNSQTSIMRVVKDALPRVGEAGEQAPRMALFKRELNKNLPNWRNMTPEEIAATPAARAAAADAVELTINFARGGWLIKSLNPFMIFLNAGMEGMKLPFRSLRDNPAARMRLAGAGVAVAGIQAYNMSYPEFFDISDDRRRGSVLFMLPSKEKDITGRNKPNYLTVIPRTRTFALFFAPIQFAMEKMFSDNPTDFVSFSKTLLPNILPTASVPGPEVIEELFGQLANYDFYRGRDMIPSELQSMQDKTKQVMPWTSRTMQEVGERIGVSPIRLESAFSGILGGAYKTAASLTDWIIQQVAPRQVDDATRQMMETYKAFDNSRDRREYMTTLGQEERDALTIELHQPKATIPLVGPIKERFYGPRGGQLRRTFEEDAAKRYGIDVKETRQAQGYLRILAGEMLTTQQDIDENLNNNDITLKQWKAERKEMGSRYRGALDLVRVQFPGAAQVQEDPKVQQAYFDSITKLGGQAPDDFTQGRILVSGWYAITLDEPTPGSKNWDKFFSARRAYKDALSEEERDILDSELQATQTPTEKEYNADIEFIQASARRLYKVNGEPLFDNPVTYWDITRELAKKYDLEADYDDYLASANPSFLDDNEDLKAVVNAGSAFKLIFREHNPDIDRKLWKWEYVDEPQSEGLAQEVAALNERLSGQPYNRREIDAVQPVPAGVR
jgi:hypothetical protein